MQNEFKYLFTPLRIGNVVVKNRLFSPAYQTGLATDSMPGQRFLRYQLERAQGGLSLIILPGIVHPSGHSTRGAPHIYLFADRIIPYYKKLSNAVHKEGTKMFQQLAHCGMHTKYDDTLLPVWAPSPIPSTHKRETPREINVDEMQEVTDSYAKAARRAKEGGLDGVEIHASTSSIVLQFLSPLTNRRQDEYGGSLENRLKFLLQIIGEVRNEVGTDFVLGVRLCADEFVEGGLTIDDAKQIGRFLESTKKIDYLNINAANYYNYYMIVPPMDVSLGYLVPYAAEIKEQVENVPIFVAGRITDPVQAEQILADRQADMIGVARAAICDPQFAKKAREGRIEDIRTCVGCNQMCIGGLFRGKHISCTQNPAAGREESMGVKTILPAKSPKNVLVIGGGPAGLETARVAALRGHRVTLYEKSDELGGQVNLAKKAPMREELGDITRFLERQVRNLGVGLRLGVEAKSPTIRREQADAVVVATGSVPQRNGFSFYHPSMEGIPGADRPNVFTVWDVLMDKEDIGIRIVVVDERGDTQGPSVAEYLADKGKVVTIVSWFLSVGLDYSPTQGLKLLYTRLFEKGIVMVPQTGVKEIKENKVVTSHVYSGEESEIEADSVVLAMGYTANDSLYRELEGGIEELYAVGSCVAPRNIFMAIYEGNKVARRL